MTVYFSMLGEGVNPQTAYSVSTSTPEIPGPPFKVGTTILGSDGSSWVFVLLSGSCTAGDFLVVTAEATWTVAQLTNTTGRSFLGRKVGVAGATGTTGQYLWMQTDGYNNTVNAITGATAWTAMHSTTTGGRITATAGVGTSVTINGVVLNATAASNIGVAVLNSPTIGAND